MQLIRFIYQNQIRYGKVTGEQISLFTDGYLSKLSGERAKREEIKLLPPTVPTKIVAVGLNYIDHTKEMNDRIPEFPVLFLKPPSSVLASGETIIKPKICKRLDYEAELAFVLKKRCKNIKKEDFSQYILGYTCFNDVTARDLQKVDGQWTRAKGFDTFSPFGEVIETEVDFQNLRVRAVLNGKTVQDGNTKDMIFDIPTLLAFISNVMTLEEGDVVTTGTPSGIGEMKKGDTIEIVIDKVGHLVSTVTEEE